MMTDRVFSALQPIWLICLGRARTRDQPVLRRKGYPDRFRGSPPRSSVDAMPYLIVMFLCQVVGDVTPTAHRPRKEGRWPLQGPTLPPGVSNGRGTSQS